MAKEPLELSGPDGSPLGVDDLEPHGESPYLRRQKAVPVRHRAFSRRLGWTLFALGILLPVGCAGFFLATFALNSPLFTLSSPDDVVVEGNRYVSREEILGALGLPLTRGRHAGANVFRLSLDGERRLVETVPWVRTATVTRILPQGLLVHITERTPVAFATAGGRVNLVDDEGMLLDKPEKGVFDFPVINGIESLPSLDDRRIRLALYQEFMRQLAEEVPRSGWMISEVDLSDGEDTEGFADSWTTDDSSTLRP